MEFRFDQLTFANFREAWRVLDSYAVNSLIITVLAVVLTVTLGTLAAYAYVWMNLRFKRSSYFLLITTMIVPVQIILCAAAAVVPQPRVDGELEGVRRNCPRAHGVRSRLSGDS